VRWCVLVYLVSLFRRAPYAPVVAHSAKPPAVVSALEEGLTTYDNSRKTGGLT
jgi:hypothetical protein